VPVGLLSDFRYRKISQSATVNDLLKEFFRKSIHLCASIVPFLAAWNFRFTTIALAAIICIYALCEFSRLTGRAIPYISRITAYASRKRDEGRFVLGPVTLGLGVLLTLLFFPPKAALIGIFALAFGDGVASLAGKIWGKRKIPYLRGKTLEGSTACFGAVFISSLALTRDPLQSLEIALLTVLVEALPIRDYDNLLIPLIVGAFICLLP